MFVNFDEQNYQGCCKSSDNLSVDLIEISDQKPVVADTPAQIN